jgi:hypothetical protein
MTQAQRVTFQRGLAHPEQFPIQVWLVRCFGVVALAIGLVGLRLLLAELAWPIGN